MATYTGPRGSAVATRIARRIEPGIDAIVAGWSSHFVKSRTAAPCTFAVWTQSMFGRRRVASIGPAPPSTSTGERSMYA
jgi:hypothetical protein